MRKSGYNIIGGGFMPLKEDGNKIKKTVIFDKKDYDTLSEMAVESKTKGEKDKNSISDHVRLAIKQYLGAAKPEILDYLFKYTKRELINYFTVEEATLIIASLNGTLYEISMINPKIVLIGNVEDSIDLDGFDSLYQVDKKMLLDKLSKLSEFQSYMVLNMSFEFWEEASGNPLDECNQRLKRIFLIKAGEQK